MTTYSVRCCNSKCRHRRITKTHPFDYKVVPKCDSCKQAVGWRIESRAYNKRNLCYCGGPVNPKTAMPYPHKSNHPMCDQHPLGYYNQARARGIEDHDIPEEYRPTQVAIPDTSYTISNRKQQLAGQIYSQSCQAN